MKIRPIVAKVKVCTGCVGGKQVTVFPTSARARRPEKQFQKSRQSKLEARVWRGLPRGYARAGGLASTLKGPENSFSACYSYQKD